ncbi:hypothetical protein AB1Y20_015561 [Prymnesium parvum]|uniref:EF-hand domain-containing protein n=1 Tax=Prymnesium parvum TaxID=97485 RepID=A0AB34K1U3_PRYPA
MATRGRSATCDAAARPNAADRLASVPPPLGLPPRRSYGSHRQLSRAGSRGLLCDNAFSTSFVARRSSADLNRAAAVASSRVPRGLRDRLQLFIDEHQSSLAAKYTWILLMSLVVVSIAVLCVQTLDGEGARFDCATIRALKLVEVSCNVAFSLEVAARLVAYSVDFDSMRQLAREKLFYVDVLGILPFYIELVSYAIPGTDEYGKGLLDCDRGNNATGYTSFLMLLRLLRGLRLLKLVRHFPGWRVLILALRRCWEALLVPAFFLIICVFMMAGLVYVAENCCNEDGGPSRDFDNMFQSIWFVLVTFTTVGYGDIYPATPQGKLVAAGSILLGILFTAMPITIMGQSFADAWEEKETIQIGLKLQEYLIRRGDDPHQIVDIFRAFDQGGNEALDIDEFREALKVLGWQSEGRKVNKLFNMFDVDGDGQVD